MRTAGAEQQQRRPLKAVDAAATLSTGAARKGAGRSPGTCQGRRRWQRPAHARPLPEARNAEGRAPPFARARRRWPRLPRLRSLSEPLRRVRALSPADPRSRFPPLQAPSPSCPPSWPQPTRPFLSPRNGAGTARGRAPWTRLALGLALSATARLAPPRALPQSVAPKAPLSGGGGGSCFRFFLSVQSGVASSTQPAFPLPQRGAAALRAVALAAATGSGGDRLCSRLGM
nr:gametogenetin-like [Symphalangus syndactylus]